MSEEKIIEEKECKCFCKSEGFRNFLVTALGTFVGVYMALSLFGAIHKPPMPCHCMMKHHHQIEGHYKHHKDFKKFNKEFKGDTEQGGKPVLPNEDD
ncbi:MAG: hypothetical protein IJ877_04895 [Candidatus Gastranaerophilales bacterium]|nr:hypothetical protein [Candidatus Gastranaerophilales bacterium]